MLCPHPVSAARNADMPAEPTSGNRRIAPAPGRADSVRAKLAELGLSEADIAGAVAWARSGGGEAGG